MNYHDIEIKGEKGPAHFLPHRIQPNLQSAVGVADDIVPGWMYGILGFFLGVGAASLMYAMVIA